MKKNCFFVFVLLIVHFFYLSGCSGQKTDAVKVGELAPAFSLPELKGNKIGLSDVSGKVVLIRFWSINCLFCAKEMPELEEIYRTHKDKGMTILAINVRQPKEAVERFAKEKNLSYPILLDKYSKTAKKYGLIGLPTSIIVDRNGYVREKIVGEIEKNAIEHLIVNLL